MATIEELTRAANVDLSALVKTVDAKAQTDARTIREELGVISARDVDPDTLRAQLTEAIATDVAEMAQAASAGDMDRVAFLAQRITTNRAKLPALQAAPAYDIWRADHAFAHMIRPLSVLRLPVGTDVAQLPAEIRARVKDGRYIYPSADDLRAHHAKIRLLVSDASARFHGGVNAALAIMRGDKRISDALDHMDQKSQEETASEWIGQLAYPATIAPMFRILDADEHGNALIVNGITHHTELFLTSAVAYSGKKTSVKSQLVGSAYNWRASTITADTDAPDGYTRGKVAYVDAVNMIIDAMQAPSLYRAMCEHADRCMFAMRANDRVDYAVTYIRPFGGKEWKLPASNAINVKPVTDAKQDILAMLRKPKTGQPARA